ncbi:hypothetical protein JKF63_05497 [Porcisia hertigi]|uniref:Uncharacterized protein n=1 Tax=Porcisia hertigi TaxID=2761500 RepID=A0A836IVY7_9TRYP|nr:hypothetical protein JKF63_05497 [Porcisia hertigi]
MLSSATHQLRALRVMQHTKRAVVEEHMTAYDAAKHAYEMAQRQEAELRANLHAAEARTAQLRLHFDAAEAELRNATTHLSHTQLLCHSLESRIAEHVRCQRSAVLLAALPSSSISPPSRPQPLCLMDPYSLFHTAMGEAYTYDLVELGRRAASCHPAGMYTGEGGDNLSEIGGREGSADVETDRGTHEGHAPDTAADDPPNSPTIESLLTDAVQDVLRGYHYTFFCTSVHGCSLCSSQGSPTRGVCLAAMSSIKSAADGVCGHPSRHHSSLHPGDLCLRLLQLLQREALRSSTRALNVTLAAGSVGRDEAARTPRGEFTTMAGSAAASPRGAAEYGWTDLLHPIAARHQQETVAMEAAPLDERFERELPSMSLDPSSMRRRSVSSIGAVSSLDGGSMPSGVNCGRQLSRPSLGSTDERAMAMHVPTLEGVPLGSIEDAAFWLQEAGLLAAVDTFNCRLNTAALKSSTPPSSGNLGSKATTSVVVVLVGVDTQDATGKLHKSLFRIVGDSHFDPEGFDGSRVLRKGGSRGRSVDAAACCAPSTFSLYMSHVLGALARTAASNSSGSADLELSTAQLRNNHPRASAASFLTEMLVLQRAEIAPLSVQEVRTVAHRMSLRYPEGTCAFSRASDNYASMPPPHIRAAWSLWATLLRSVFGGNSKALWIHCTSTGDSCSNAEDRGSDIDAHDAAKAASFLGGCHSSRVQRNDTAALRLSALFCRLVRHDAVASEMSPDLARFTRIRA